MLIPMEKSTKRERGVDRVSVRPDPPRANPFRRSILSRLIIMRIMKEAPTGMNR